MRNLQEQVTKKEQFFLTVGQNNFGNKIPFLQKTKPLNPHPKYLFGIEIWIWVAKN